MALCRRTMQGTMSQTRVLIPPRHVGNRSRFLFNAIDRIDFFFPLHFFFFLIIPGLIATRLVNRVSFVHSACSFLLFRSFIVSAPILSPRFNSESFHTNFRIVFGPLISSIYLTRKRCVARSFQNRTVH